MALMACWDPLELFVSAPWGLGSGVGVRGGAGGAALEGCGGGNGGACGWVGGWAFRLM